VLEEAEPALNGHLRFVFLKAISHAFEFAQFGHQKVLIAM